jgi:hypothetical protein
VTVHRGRAFGLDLEADFELPGMDPAGPPTGRPVRLRLGEPETDAAGRGERIAEAPGAAVDVVPGGFLARAEGVGRAWIADRGDEIAWAPESPDAQRFLGGQVLPFAAVLQGLEVFHASAVVAGGRALAVVAGSGVGKTTLALELVRRGLAFLDDDVLVLDGELLAYPGPALANVGEERVPVARHQEPVPLGALCFLDRAPRGAAAASPTATVERLDPVDPKLLLAATFNLALRTPERLTRQLEVCGRIAESAVVLRARCPAGVAPAALAELIHDAVRAREPA